jgi:hypothetical protein
LSSHGSPVAARDIDTRLPNGGRAELDVRKLTDYCLSPDHPRGRHKARVFWDALLLEQSDAAELCAHFLLAAREETGVRLTSDEWGERWQVDVAISRQKPPRGGTNHLDRAERG